MGRSIVRVGNLRTLFKAGTSEMYSRTAQICVLYEDLRIETGRLFALATSLDLNGDLTEHTFEVLYYIRRSTASLMEFAGALSGLAADKEFKRLLGSLEEKHANAITEANRYFQKNRQLIRRLRNDFGGHFKLEYARHATANLPPDEVGKMEWLSDASAAWSLKIDLAANIITSGLEYTLQPQLDWREEFRTAIDTISKAFPHVQTATYSLALNFLWRRMA